MWAGRRTHSEAGVRLLRNPFQINRVQTKRDEVSLVFQQLYEILARTPYGSVRKGEVGIDRLVNEGVFTAAYPLHEVRPEP